MSNDKEYQELSEAVEYAAGAIKNYIDYRNSKGHLRSDLASHVYDFFGRYYYDETLRQYPVLCSNFLLLLVTDQELKQTLENKLGGHAINDFARMMQSTIEFCAWVHSDELNSAEMLWTDLDAGISPHMTIEEARLIKATWESKLVLLKQEKE